MTAAVTRLQQRTLQLTRVAGKILRWGIPRRGLLFGPLSLGDDLLCTAVLREARLRGRPFTMYTARPELFLNNQDPARVLPIDDYFIAAIRRLGAEVTQPYYASSSPDSVDRQLLPSRHIIAQMCQLSGLTGTVSLRPYLNLTAEEKKFGVFSPRQIAIQSSGLSAAFPFKNKEWGVDRFTSLTRFFGEEFTLVQIGATSDPALPVAFDLRGKTTLREAAAVLSNSAVLIGLEGFLVHLARAVDCPAVVIFGGRASPEIFGYSANRNLFSAIACSPCGLIDTCDYDRVCMDKISPQEVYLATLGLLRSQRENLPTDVVDVQ